jgi:hypothetical protein
VLRLCQPCASASVTLAPDETTRERDHDPGIEALAAEHCMQLLNGPPLQSLRDPESYYARQSREGPGYLANQSPCKSCRGIPSLPSAGHEPTNGIALSEHRHSTE